MNTDSIHLYHTFLFSPDVYFYFLILLSLLVFLHSSVHICAEMSKKKLSIYISYFIFLAKSFTFYLFYSFVQSSKNWNLRPWLQKIVFFLQLVVIINKTGRSSSPVFLFSKVIIKWKERNGEWKDLESKELFYFIELRIFGLVVRFQNPS